MDFITLNYFLLFFSIGKGSGYKRSELSVLIDGSSLVVGGKELEVFQSYNMYMYVSGHQKINIHSVLLYSPIVKCMRLYLHRK